MKTIPVEKLNQVLYTDRAKTIPAKLRQNFDVDTDAATCTPRQFLQWIIDQPIEKGFSREISKKVDRIWNALAENPDGEAKFEETDFTYLKGLIDKCQVSSKQVYDTLCEVIDSAK